LNTIQIVQIAFFQFMEKSIMRTLILCLLITSLFQGCTSFPTQGVQGERRVALVIGNFDYSKEAQEDKPLKDWINAPSVKKDVEDMTNTLRSLGFHVLQVKNADKKQMEVALQAFKALLKKEANTFVQANNTETEDKTTEKENTLVALFYYAGHGLTSGNETYLVPIGMKTENLSKEEYLKENAFTRTKVYEVYNDEALKSIKKRINFVILDACRTDLQIPPNNNEHNDNDGNVSLGVEREIADSEEKKPATSGSNPGKEIPPYTFLGYATAKYSSATAFKDEQKNSVYTEKLLYFISKPGLFVFELFDKVGKAVVEERRENSPDKPTQKPHFSSNEMSEVNFVFRPEAVNQTPRW